ncbi:MAG: IS3 family transposase [Bacteroidales bacterium]|nr:IS3 family transposase [Bacteroidales bacterium]
METRKKIVCRMVSQGMRTTKALAIARIPRSTYYYKAIGRPKGKSPSSQTMHNGKWVDNQQVLDAIKELLGQEFIDYGYIRTTQDLKQQGYTINKKKVYRLMKEHKLLYPKKPVISTEKVYVKYSSPLCSRPFEVMEIDIKYVYIQGIRKHAYLITILDIFTRIALVWGLNWDMKTQRVIELLNELYSKWLIPYGVDPKLTQVKIRTDNGSQFIAKLFRSHLNDAGIKNEYIHPGTPQQNGHIEAFHKTVSALVCRKFELDTLEQAVQILTRFYKAYNNKRIMKAILYKTPVEFFELWLKGQIGINIKNEKIKYFFREKAIGNQLAPSSEFLKMQNKINEKYNECLTINYSPFLGPLLLLS